MSFKYILTHVIIYIYVYFLYLGILIYYISKPRSYSIGEKKKKSKHKILTSVVQAELKVVNVVVTSTMSPFIGMSPPTLCPSQETVPIPSKLRFL